MINNARINGWVWNPDKLQLTHDVKIKFRFKPTNSYTNNIIHINLDGTAVIFSGFIWNGATGVPSGKKLTSIHDLPVKSLNGKKIPFLWKQTLKHDVCYLLLHTLDDNNNPFPYSRYQSDKEFYLDCVKAKFGHSRLYYIGVRLFGSLVIAGKKIKRCIYSLFKRKQRVAASEQGDPPTAPPYQ